ncbi:hypothetical protein [uncultured Sphingomonas sp.]|uniref:GFA family protein n=1 Tax=uncultured Sphingomonas sp. TaxID=158754 RepID=UPI0025CDEF4E|nr:hypothetical protein [uncultured Sphingomonas sp.]
MNGTCHCGQLSIRLPEPPAFLNLCNCTVCTKLGTMWGYYDPSVVEIDGAPSTYMRADVDSPTLTFHFCGACGSTTHWSSRDLSVEQVGINMRLFEPSSLSGIEVRYGDRRTYAKGSRRYYREPTIFSETGAAA